MFVRSPLPLLALTVAAFVSAPVPGRAADWPMFRHDANRSAATPAALPATLHPHWVRELPALKPAWPDQPKMQLDSVYEPIVLGKTLFVGSSRTDTLTAYDTATGKEKWRFHAEGPVRFAPAGGGGKVYVAADDGYLYCLDALAGKLLWKFRGGPSDRKVLGNERLISTWPARGAPVLHEGKVYFAASIWPFMGVFIHCLDADTGNVVWTNDGDGSVYMKQPHNADSFAGVAPQGPLVIAGDQLVVPGGRSVPAIFDLKTGKSLRYQLAENGKKGGGSLVAVMGKHLFNGGAVFHLDTEKHIAAFGDPVVLTPDVAHGYAGGVIKAYDLKNSLVEETETVDKKGAKTKLSQWQIKQVGSFKLPKLETMIRAGSRLYVGTPGEVQAFDLPFKANAEPSWQATVDGTPASLIAADGRLFVVTREGRIHCFGGEQVKPLTHRFAPTRPALEEKWILTAKNLIESAKVRDGYCVVWGVGSGNLIHALIQTSDLRLLVVEPNAGKAHACRDLLAATDLYGERVTVHVGEPLTFPLPPYLASLMVSEDLAAAGVAPGLEFIAKAFQTLRPYGGVALLPLAEDKTKGLIAGIAAAKLPGAQAAATVDGLRLVRAGALPGAGNWTHEHGDAANTRVAPDRLVKAPLGVLWFGGPSHDGILPRHGHGPQPQVIDGRCIIEGVDMLRAIDIYTGRLLWETKLPGIGFFYNNLLHQPGANASGGNVVSTSDAIYAVLGSECKVLDPVTGKIVGTFTLPLLGDAQAEPRWGYLNVQGDHLIGGADPLFDEKLFKDAIISKDDKGVADDGKKKTDSATKLLKALRSNEDYFSSSKHLVVMDRHTGKVRWTATARNGYRHNAVCVGGEKLYAIDRLSGAELARLKRRGEEPKFAARLIVFDLKTGKELWSTDTDVFGTWLSYSAKYDVLVEAGRVARDTISDEPKGMRAYQATTGKELWHHAKYVGPAMLHDRTVLKDQSACDLLTGEPKMRPHPLTGEPVPWEWSRTHGCNTPLASEHLLTFRSGAAGYLDLCNDGGTGNLGGFRSSCTNNLIVAGGVLTAPEYTRTCSCSYQNQTSIGLVHMPEAEMWTSFGSLELKGIVKRVGISLGAPGDRRADDGTLWLEYPSVGGKSPALEVKVAGAKLDWFRRHSSRVEGPLNWVTASGVKGLTSLTVTLGKDKEPRNYTVRLHFAEPEQLKAGQRVFDVLLQKQEVLKDFDIVKESGGPNRGLVREFKGVSAGDALTVAFRPSAQATVGAAVLCGVEIVAESVGQGLK